MKLIKLADDLDDLNGQLEIPIRRKRWVPSIDHHHLVKWLMDNVGESHDSVFRLPLRGEGWRIAYGYSEDEILLDYHYFTTFRTPSDYQPKGELAIWLQIDDDSKAMELILSEVYEFK